MGAATITSKRQVTIPKAGRAPLGLRPGGRVVFTVLQDGTTIMRVKTGSIQVLAGMLHEPGRSVVPIENLRSEQ